MSYGTRVPNCCRVWLPDAILVAGEKLHGALMGTGTTSNFAHLQKKYPLVRFHILGTASIALPPYQRLHVEAQCNDTNILISVESDLVDLAETACDVAGDALGMNDDQVQDIFEMIRVERCISDAALPPPLPPQEWAPQAYGLSSERLLPGAMAKRLPQKRPVPPPPPQVLLAPPQAPPPAPVAAVGALPTMAL